jgi:hypothetical protein
MKKGNKNSFTLGKQASPPAFAAREYQVLLLSLIRAANDLFREEVAPLINVKSPSKMIADADMKPGVTAEQLALAFDVMRTGMVAAKRKAFKQFGIYLGGLRGATSQRYWDAALTAALTENDKAARREAQREVLSIPSIAQTAAEEGVTDLLKQFSDASVSLITKLSDEHINQLQGVIFDNFIDGKFQGKGGLKAHLQNVYEMSANRAKLIARDQSNKMVGQMNMVRAIRSGSVGYQWNNVGDTRVRGNPSGKYPKAKSNHWKRQGQYFLWRKMDDPPIAPDGKPFRQPPEKGNPGDEINCRCWADPVFVFD